MRQLYNRIGALDRTANRKKSRQAGLEVTRAFAIVCYCPPRAGVRIMDGRVYEDTIFWFAVNYDARLPALDVDFTDLSETPIVGGERTAEDGDPLTLSFDNANWYRAFVLSYDWEWLSNRDWNPGYPGYTFRCNGGWVEYQTAAEAEASIDLILNGTAMLNTQYHFPLSGFVLRNDGTTGQDGAVLPVDPINRGRSYVYRAVKPRTYLTS